MGVQALAIAPTRPQTVYAGVSYATPADCGAGSTIRCGDNAVLLKTTDGGTSWQPTDLALGPDSLGALAVDPKGPGTLYAAVGATVLESHDAGDSWQAISNGGGSDNQALPGNHDVSSLAVDPSGAVFAAMRTDDGGIFKTADAGATWTHVVSGVSVDHLAVDPKQPDDDLRRRHSVVCDRENCRSCRQDPRLQKHRRRPHLGDRGVNHKGVLSTHFFSTARRTAALR